MGRIYQRKCIVISAVNFTEGGPLTVLQDCLSIAEKTLPSSWKIIALVNDRKLFHSLKRTKFLEFPRSKTSWIRRILLEYYFFYKISLRLVPSLWLSLHDVSPRVHCKEQVVYCHNPLPFYKFTYKDIKFAPKVFFLSLVYRIFYRIYIHRNKYVIVQQNWLRNEFCKILHHRNIIVSYPTKDIPKKRGSHIKYSNSKCVLFYPAFPRVFKNFELLCEAVKCLPQDIKQKIELRLTIDGSENSYANYLFSKYNSIDCIRFIGLQKTSEMSRLYNEADCLLFPSKIETWGLPITEAKIFNKPLLVANEPYAIETVGNYNHVNFLPIGNIEEWSAAIQLFAMGNLQFGTNQVEKPQAPFTTCWEDLWQLITQNIVSSEERSE